MGPGYVPVVLGGILTVLGAVIAVQAFRGGDPHLREVKDERGPVPWVRGGMLVAGIVFFGATIEGLGLAPTLFVTTFVAALAGHRSGPLKALAISVGLTVLSLGIFVRIAAAAPAAVRRLAGRHESWILRTGPGARDGPPAEQHPDLSARRHARHHGGRAPGHRADRHRRAAAPDHLQLRPDRVADHARRHLLRRAVRRLDHRDPDQPAWRVLGRESPRWTGTRWRDRAEPDRRSPRGAGLLLRRDRRDRPRRAVRSADGLRGARVRPG